ncbi:TPA: hypothetical protein SAO13_001382 [Burkholderia multivorans]|uniref:hypothetical protein n=1 Tax=Burkholderia multivorans TaxID=87883 RepID=UPI0015919316|nr:hypothetical protein [Burkholderia multivorans]MBU9238743.1 hypothetical protein [Burkholderia multivorans]HEF4747424.1 hypothetical protein [Burkholderia multivorans]
MATKKFTRAAQDLFIQVLEDTCSPKQAAAAVGISRRLAFDYKQKDTEFRARWEKAIEVALDALLDEAYRRAAIGYEEPVIHGGQLSTVTDPTTGEQRPLTVRKHSDRLLEVLLKFRYGDQMADRLRVKVDESSGLDAAALLAMPSEDRKALTALLAKYEANKEREDGGS